MFSGKTVWKNTFNHLDSTSSDCSRDFHNFHYISKFRLPASVQCIELHPGDLLHNHSEVTVPVTAVLSFHVEIDLRLIFEVALCFLFWWYPDRYKMVFLHRSYRVFLLCLFCELSLPTSLKSLSESSQREFWVCHKLSRNSQPRLTADEFKESSEFSESPSGWFPGDLAMNRSIERYVIFLYLKIITFFFRERECVCEGGGGAQRDRERIVSRLHTQHRVPTQGSISWLRIMTWTKTKSQTLNWLSHQGAQR